jgi:hypothetical protein
VTLSLDQSVAVRTRAQQQALVRAVFEAPLDEPETASLEWKTRVNLAEKRWQAQAGKHIIGFANRHPDAALRLFEGCAYLLLGVAPGELEGTVVHDPADLDGWVTAYVGTIPDAPSWNATYVSIGGTSVLLVTIERPKWGDPIWTLRKTYAPDPRTHSNGTKEEPSLREGTVFIRREGRTDQANTAELRTLTHRAGAGPRRLSLDLRMEAGDTAIAIDDGDERREAWLTGEGRALTPSGKAPATSRRPTDNVLDALAAQSAEALKGFGETRTRDAYEKEVQTYLVGARRGYSARLKRGAIRHELGEIHLWIDNETEHNFADVVVDLTFPQSAIEAYFDEGQVKGPAFPSRPDPWGSFTMDRFLRAPILSLTTLPGVVPARSPRGRIINGGSSSIRFAGVDVRPGHSHRVATFYLIVGPAQAGGLVEGNWVATARDVSGIAQGNLSVPVAAEVPPTAQLMARPVQNPAAHK